MMSKSTYKKKHYQKKTGTKAKLRDAKAGKRQKKRGRRGGYIRLQR